MRMFWRVLKPHPGLADKPSVCKRSLSSRFLIILAAVTGALCASSATASSGSLSSGGRNGDKAKIAGVSLLTNSSTGALGGESWAIARSVLPGYTIRRIASEVRLQFSVTDEQRLLVTGLSSSDFRIFDDQSAVQRVRNFSRMEDLPLQIGILLDVSDSVQKTVFHEKLATQFFVRQVLRPQTDRAFLLAFSQDVKLWQPSTGNPDALRQALDRIHQIGYATNLYDGVFDGCLNHFPQSGENGIAQRIIILFSDGEDTGSLHALADTIALAQRREIQIYALSVHPQRKYSPGDSVLHRLAEETGGQFYVVGSEKDFVTIFAAMDRQMRTQYYVSFRPEGDTPGFHQLRLEMTRPGKLRIHARQGYYFDAP
jgi:VWFA-related protein